MDKNAIIQNLVWLGYLSSCIFLHWATSLPLVTIALILTAVCGSHLTLYYHLTFIPRSCAQSTNGVQASWWRYLFNETHTCLTIKSISKTLCDGRSGRPHSSVISHLNYKRVFSSTMPSEVYVLTPRSGYFSNLRDRAASGQGTPTSDEEGGDHDEATLLAIFAANQSAVSES
jgi:hypothetical protein